MHQVIASDDDDDHNVPVVRPNWRVERQANLTRNEAATYRRAYHAPRMMALAATGMRDFSAHAAQLCAEDEYLAGYFTEWERDLAIGLLKQIRRYLDGGQPWNC
jgi:hypothetical protein